MEKTWLINVFNYFQLFSTILEIDGKLYNIMISNFPPSRDLYQDIISNNLIKQFKNYIYSFINIVNNNTQTSKTPKELFDVVVILIWIEIFPILKIAIFRKFQI